MTITRSGNFCMNSTLLCKGSSCFARHNCVEDHCEQHRAEKFCRHKETAEWLSFETLTGLFHRKVCSA